MSAALTDTQRRLANIIRIGTIEEADFAAARVKVRFGEILTGWLPFGGQRAGGMRVWNPPSVGEQVVVLSPSGDLAQGVAMPGLYSDAKPAPGSTGTAVNIVFPDGSTLSWDGGSLVFTSTAAVKIVAPTIRLEGAVTVIGNITQTGGITSSGDHVAQGVSLKTHTHGGVMSGSSNTAPPN
jgi:phage baseplate assembly protein V